MSIVDKTAGVRHGIIWGVMKLLSPKLFDEVQIWKKRAGMFDVVPRPFTLFLKKIYGGNELRGAEIGFGAGVNAANLLDLLNIKTLFCVDPFIGKVYRDSQGLVISQYDRPNIKHLLERDGRVEFIEKSSDDGLKILNDLDFVYVDGDHGFAQVLRDLKGAMGAVKVGGYVGGHDYHPIHKGVIDAVTAFTNQAKRVPTIEPPDFWFQK